MNKKLYQGIFKRSAVEQLRIDLRSGKSLKDYFEKNIKVKGKDLLNSTIETQGKIPNLKTLKKDPASEDLKNAIALHKFYRNLDETQASDPRFWAYLSHVEFRKYTFARWGIGGSYQELKNENKPIEEKEISFG